MPGVLRLDRRDHRWVRFLHWLRPSHDRREVDKRHDIRASQSQAELTGFEMFAPLLNRMAGSGASGIQS